MNTMKMSAYVFGCTVSAVSTTAPEPTPSDFLPPVVDHVVDQMVGEQLANSTHMIYDYNRHDIDIIDGTQF
jgi:hypothetical protein